MVAGLELFVGAIREGAFGHMVVCGLGGIFVEVFKDVQTRLLPLHSAEALEAVEQLRGYPLIAGARGSEGTDPKRFAEIIVRVSALVHAAPQIAELDINPLMATPGHLTAVDARIRIDRTGSNDTQGGG